MMGERQRDTFIRLYLLFNGAEAYCLRHSVIFFLLKPQSKEQEQMSAPLE